MEPTPNDRNEDSDFIFYPHHKIAGIIDDPNNCKAALHDLSAAGFTADGIEVLTGEEHGLLARTVRSLDRLGNFEPKHIRRHEQEMLAGHHGIGVIAKRTEAREKVRKILKSHHEHFINFYGELVIEELEP